LRHVDVDPRLLQSMAAIARKTFDGRNPTPIDLLHRQLAGAPRATVNMHGAGTAKPATATELGANEIERVAEDPEQRRLGVTVELAAHGIDVQCEGLHRV
jgi:hypothetical protein